MKKALAIVLSVCLLSQCLVQLGIVGYYELNKDYIAKNLCENRDKPQMKCCGKCYLRKHLKKVDENAPTGKNLPNKIDKNEAVAYVVPQPIKFSQILFSSVSVHNPVRQNMHSRDILHSIFHPPAVSC